MKTRFFLLSTFLVAGLSGNIFSEPLNPVSLSYYGVYSGPSLASPLKSGTINSGSLQYDDKSPQNLFNQLKLDFNLRSNFFLGPILNFQLTPVNGDTFALQDSGARFGHKALVSADGFYLMADFRVTAPLKPDFVSAKGKLDLQTFQYATYRVPGTKLTVGVQGFHSFQFYGSGAPRDQKDLSLSLSPNLAYSLSRALDLTLFCDLTLYHHLGERWDTFGSDPSDLAPGFQWNISPSVNINPRVIFYPSKLSFSTIATAVYINATML